MESALVSIVSVALIIIASVTMMISSLTSINSVMDSWLRMENEADEIRRTEISLSSTDNFTGQVLELFVGNEGETNISSFDDWDIIARYETGTTAYIDYTDDESPDSNEWTVEGIYLIDDISVDEKFDPGVLNPGETARILVNMDPGLGAEEYGLITASTDKGVTAQCMVQHP